MLSYFLLSNVEIFKNGVLLVFWTFVFTLNYFNSFQIRTLGMLRSRFRSLPGAFNACLIPEERIEPKKKGLKATLSRNFAQVRLYQYYVFVKIYKLSRFVIKLLRIINLSI